MQNFKEVKKVFFVGIGGIGVSALAKLFKSQSKIVAGSDKYSSEITDELKKQGIKIYIGHNRKNLDPDTDLVVYSPAVDLETPERKKAGRLGIEEMSYPEALGVISKNKYTIAVSGTHGKSTTTAMLGLILTEAGLDPTVIIGSKVGPFNNSNLRIGKSKYLVIEACEWRAHMLELSPKIIVLTNIEEDHLDYYKNFENLKEAFKLYVSRLPKDSLLIINADDKDCLEVAKSAKCKVVTYRGADLQFPLQIPGEFNTYNAAAARACALQLGIKPETIKKPLTNFKGIWRRFERVGEYKDALIFSDYAHHPTALKVTLTAAEELYPQKRLVIVFQPHHFDRTQRLFQEFIDALQGADLIILNEIYDVPGRESVKRVSSKDLVKELKRRGHKAIFAKNPRRAEKILIKNIKKNDLVLIIGAGDIYKISLNICNRKK